MEPEGEVGEKVEVKRRKRKSRVDPSVKKMRAHARQQTYAAKTKRIPIDLDVHRQWCDYAAHVGVTARELATILLENAVLETRNRKLSPQSRIQLHHSAAEWMETQRIFEEHLDQHEHSASSRLGASMQDQFAAHLLDVHRRWCKACPLSARPHHSFHSSLPRTADTIPPACEQSERLLPQPASIASTDVGPERYLDDEAALSPASDQLSDSSDDLSHDQSCDETMRHSSLGEPSPAPMVRVKEEPPDIDEIGQPSDLSGDLSHDQSHHENMWNVVEVKLEDQEACVTCTTDDDQPGGSWDAQGIMSPDHSCNEAMVEVGDLEESRDESESLCSSDSQADVDCAVNDGEKRSVKKKKMKGLGTRWKHFPSASDEESDSLVDLDLDVEELDSSKTKDVITYALRILKAYCKSQSVIFEALEKLPVAGLCTFLRSFYGHVCQSNGELYAKRSLITLRYGLQRYFKQRLFIDITNDQDFQAANVMFKTVLKRSDTRKRHELVTIEDMMKIMMSSALDTSTPLGLQNKVFVDLLLHLHVCSKGKLNLRAMKKGHFAVSRDLQKHRYVHIVSETKGKEPSGDCDDGESRSARMYETHDEYCPVESYLAYVSRLNPDSTAFWQRPKSKRPVDESSPWYESMPLGVNTIAKKMSQISVEAECSRIYTNHCLRATTINTLNAAGFEARDDMSVSGHKTETFIKHYTRAQEHLKRSISQAISENQLSGTSSPPPSKRPAPSTNSKVPASPPAPP